MNKHNESIMEEYRQNHNKYEELERTAVSLLENELKQSGIMVFQLSHRLKAVDSLKGKLEKKGDKYESALDLTDLLGIRVICYFSDDVDRIARTIEGLFIIDRENSIDKRRVLDDDQFGYLSLHYICKLNPDQTDVEDLWKIRFEIQIRSVLQHAWAEINHDIGYKSSKGVPHSIIRNFSRLAGLLELIDEQFVTIRDQVRNYENESIEIVKNENLADLPINVVTLYAFLQNDAFIQQFFKENGIELRMEGCDESAERLEALDIVTMDQFSHMVRDTLDKALELAIYENGDEKPESISGGHLIRLLIEVKLLKSDNPLTEIHDYIVGYYGSGNASERRRKDMLKYLKRLKKRKEAKEEGSSLL